jgi:hypothetical protein
MEKVKERILKASDVRKLPAGAKVIRRNGRRDEVWEIVMDGRHKKLFRCDKWNEAIQRRQISDQDVYLEVRKR